MICTPGFIFADRLNATFGKSVPPFAYFVGRNVEPLRNNFVL